MAATPPVPTPVQVKRAKFPYAEQSFTSSNEIKRMSDGDLEKLYWHTFGIHATDVEEYTTFNAENGMHLKNYQLRAIFCALVRSSFGFTMKMGTGKTLSACACIYWYKKFGIAKKKALFLVPGRTAVGSILDDLAVKTVLLGSKFSTTDLDYEGSDIVVGTYAAFRRFLLADNMNKYKKGTLKINPDKMKWVYEQFDMFILDEFHSVKNDDAVLSKSLQTLLSDRSKVALLLGMSGTPIGSRVIDLFHQMLLLDGGDTFGSSIDLFRSAYMKETLRKQRIYVPKERMYVMRELIDYETKVECLPEIKEKASKWMITYDTDEVSDLPPFKFWIHRYRLAGDILAYYTAVEKGKPFNIKETTILPTTPHQKQLQLCSGFLYEKEEDTGRSSNRKYHQIDGVPVKATRAVKELHRIFKENPSAVVVLFYHYEASESIIIKALRAAYLNYLVLGHGDSVLATRTKLKEINDSKGKLVIVASIGSSGQSLNLQRAAYVVYYDLPVGVNNLGQSLYRIRRIGSTGEYLEAHFFSGVTVSEEGEEVPGVEEHALHNLQKGNIVASSIYSMTAHKKMDKTKWVDPEAFAPVMNYWTPGEEAEDTVILNQSSSRQPSPPASGFAALKAALDKARLRMNEIQSQPKPAEAVTATVPLPLAPNQSSTAAPQPSMSVADLLARLRTQNGQK